MTLVMESHVVYDRYLDRCGPTRSGIVLEDLHNPSATGPNFRSRFYFFAAEIVRPRATERRNTD
jgi:hypothetical protein